MTRACAALVLFVLVATAAADLLGLALAGAAILALGLHPGTARRADGRIDWRAPGNLACAAAGLAVVGWTVGSACLGLLRAGALAASGGGGLAGALAAGPVAGASLLTALYALGWLAKGHTRMRQR